MKQLIKNIIFGRPTKGERLEITKKVKSTYPNNMSATNYQKDWAKLERKPIYTHELN